MVEKIKLLNMLNRVELIKLLDIDNIDLEKLLDLNILIKKELKDKYDLIKKIEFKDEYNGFYNMKVDEIYYNLVGFMDLIRLINIKGMDYCELLYFNVLVEDEISRRIGDNNIFNSNEDKIFSLNDDYFGKINFLSLGDVVVGVDFKYNFYIGKIDENMNCLLFNIIRKSNVCEMNRDIFVFNGTIVNKKILNGYWSIGSKTVTEGINKINTMNNYYNVEDKSSVVFDKRDLLKAYVACDEYTNNVGGLVKKINVKKLSIS